MHDRGAQQSLEVSRLAWPIGPYDPCGMHLLRFARQRACLVIVGSLLASAAAADGAEQEPQPEFHLPPHFSIQQAAGPPEVHFPMFATLDDHRRLFITESSGGDLYAELERKVKGCRISRLSETPGTGRYDRATVFAEGLSPSMGLVWHDHKLYVADPPDLVVLEDTDDDGRADKRTTLLSGFGHSDNGSLHGLIFGPDGRLYFTMGNPDGYDLTGPDGSRAHSRTGALIRCRADGSRVETIAVGFENLVEIAWLRDGSMIGTLNWYYLPERGVRDALVQLLEGGQYPLHAVQRGDMPIDFNALLPAISSYPAVAQSGLMRYAGTAFPADMRDNLFSAEHNTRKISRHILSPRQASYSVQDVDFVTTDDPNAHFSDVLEDSDGSLLIIDTGSWYVHHCPTGHILNSPARGGVYRIRYEGPHTGGPAEKGRDDDAATVTSLRQRLRSTNDVEAAYAARALGRLGEKGVTAELGQLLKSENLQLRLAAAEALSHCGDESCIGGLKEALAGRTDEFLTHALTYALHQVAGRESLEAALQDPSPKVQRAALLLLAQPPFQVASATEVGQRLFAEYGPLRETARWVLEHHPEWGSTGAAYVSALAKLALPTDADRAALERALPQFQSHQSVVDAITDCLKGNQEGVGAEQQGRLLEALATAQLKSIPVPWADAVRDLLTGNNAVLLEHAIQAAATLKISAVEPALTQVARDSSQAAALRVSALREFVRRQAKLADMDFAFLEGQLARNNPANVRLAASETLLAATLSSSQLVSFLKTIRGENLISPLAVLTAVEREGIGEAALPLLDYLEASLESGWTLPADRLMAIQNALPAAEKFGAQKLLDKLAGRAAEQKQKLTEYEPLLAGGDHQRGQVLFYNKATCSTCHSVWGIGGKVGPDLTKIGSIRAGRDILESIVLPSATLAQGYDVLNVRFKDGESTTGIRVGKSEDPLVLRDAAGNEMRYRQETIESVTRSKVSLMPEGLLQQLTREEIRDLLAFLQALK
jgi:putative membrane-bound dehydrogenase-like protein